MNVGRRKHLPVKGGVDANAEERLVPAGQLLSGAWRWAMILLVPPLLLFGWYIQGTVENALKQVFEDKLATILQADVTALEEWIDSHRRAVDVIVADASVRSPALALLESAEAEGEPPPAVSSARAELGAALEPRMLVNKLSGYVLTRADGEVIASDQAELIGKRYSAAETDFVGRALAGQTVMSRPFFSLVPLSPGSDGPAATGPTMFFAAAVRSETGRIVGVLGLRAETEDFTQILTVAAWGRSGETYAFDRSGLMISRSRFNEELKELGLLPEEEDAQSILSMRIRDPGRNLTGEGSRTSVDGPSERPLTRMAASAVQGEDGVDVDGYRDYRGITVIGAWTWLDEHDFGVATEVDTSEAFRPLRILRVAFFALFGLLVVAIVAALLFSRHVQLLRVRVRSAMVELERLGQYELECRIGSGGLGEVYRARHVLLRRPTAIKLLNPDRHSEEDISRFEREVKLASRLSHPNTIRIYDYGITPQGVFYYAMELLEGGDLAKLVQAAGPLPEGRVIHLLLQICGSLAEAHKLGLVHRDIKPGNLILTEHGGIYDFVIVTDFGLAKDVSGQQLTNITDPRFAVGTPRYLPPEAVQSGSRIDARSDLYSLGAVAYFLLVGKELFESDSVLETIRHHLYDAPASPSERRGRRISADLEGLVMSMLEKEPDNRPESTLVVVERLKLCRDYGAWTQEDARSWWEMHADELRVPGEEPWRAAQAPVEIGLAARCAAPEAVRRPGEARGAAPSQAQAGLASHTRPGP